MKQNPRLKLTWIASLLAVIVLTGCASPPPWDIPTAVVSIDMGGKTAKVPVTVTRMLPNKHSVVGIKLLQTSQLDDALRELELGVAASPADWQARIALAAAQEAKGRFDEAKTNYSKANLDKGGDADENCVAGIKRIEARKKASQ